MIWKRIKNLWKLSMMEPLENGGTREWKSDDEFIETRPTRAVIIPYNARDPVKEIIESE